jgi:hypothetical protein
MATVWPCRGEAGLIWHCTLSFVGSGVVGLEAGRTVGLVAVGVVETVVEGDVVSVGDAVGALVEPEQHDPEGDDDVLRDGSGSGSAVAPRPRNSTAMISRTPMATTIGHRNDLFGGAPALAGPSPGRAGGPGVCGGWAMTSCLPQDRRVRWQEMLSRAALRIEVDHSKGLSGALVARAKVSYGLSRV